MKEVYAMHMENKIRVEKGKDTRTYYNYTEDGKPNGIQCLDSKHAFYVDKMGNVYSPSRRRIKVDYRYEYKK